MSGRRRFKGFSRQDSKSQIANNNLAHSKPKLSHQNEKLALIINRGLTGQHVKTSDVGNAVDEAAE